MKNYLIILIIFNIYINAGLFDFLYDYKIKQSYENGNYADTLKELYNKKESAVVNYNIANCYYKLEDYEKALKFYKRSFGDGVEEYKRLYNIGNSYFKLKEYKKAVYAYKQSIKYGGKKDSDVIFNSKVLLNIIKNKKTASKEENIDKNKKQKHKKNSKKKSNKFTRDELKKLEDKLKKDSKLKSNIKEELEKIKKEKIPVIMYKVK